MDSHGKFDDVYTCNLSSSVIGYYISNFLWFLNSSYGRSNLINASRTGIYLYSIS